MNTKRSETCATCRYWHNRRASGAINPFGDCRISAPQKATVDGNGEQLTPGEPHWGVWPATSPTDWCGEWQPAPSQIHPLAEALAGLVAESMNPAKHETFVASVDGLKIGLIERLGEKTPLTISNEEICAAAPDAATLLEGFWLNPRAVIDETKTTITWTASP